MNLNLKVSTLWQWTHYRNGAVIDKWEHDNICAAEGLTKLLAYSLGGIIPTPWYFGFAKTNSHTPAETDNYVSVMSSSNYEFIAYKEATRPVFLPNTAVDKSVDNIGNEALITMDVGIQNIYGAMLVSDSTKDDNSAGPVLAFFGLFTTPKTNLEENDQLAVSLTVNLAN